MSEWKFFEDESYFTTAEWYKDREAAHHLEEPGHTDRLLAAYWYTVDIIKSDSTVNGVSDMGCGDGGLLQLLDNNGINCWGYDLQPSNIDYAQNVRQVKAFYTDFAKVEDREFGEIVIMTEVLEHLHDPHGTLKEIPEHVKYLICSSPAYETPEGHYEFHLWAWDMEGYRAMVENAGWTVRRHEIVGGWSQIIVAER